MSNQVVAFPFSTKKTDFVFHGIKTKLPARAFIIAFNSNTPIPGLPWSESISSFFIYSPELTPGGEGHISVDFGIELRAVAFRVLPWSPEAPNPHAAFKCLKVSAKGQAGEECRTYEVDYEFQMD